MNIILFANQFGPQRTIYNPHPIMPGIYRLATHLRNSGHSVNTISLWKIDKTLFKKLLIQLSSNQIQVIGISTTLLYNLPLSKEDILDFVERLQIIKTEMPQAKIVVGGSIVKSPYFSSLNSSFSLIDYFVKGQGETALDAIIDNINYKKSITTTSVTPKILSDEYYVFKDFNESKINYHASDYITSDDALGIEYSRGCIFKCSFCNFPGIGKKKGDYTKTRNTLKDEFIKNYELFGTKYYYFTDDLLNESVEKMEELAEISTSLPFDLTYSAYIRLDLINKFPKMAELLKISGMIAGQAGIETINDESGKMVLKGLGRTRIDNVLEICSSSWKGSVGLIGNFILGLPCDTPDTAYELMAWLDNPSNKSVFADINISPLKMSTEEMSDNPKYNYTWSNNKITGWTNQFSYSYDQAAIDSSMVSKHFYKNYEIPVRFSGFDLPQVLSYAEKHNVKDQIISFYFNRSKNDFIKNIDDWYLLRNKWYYSRRAQYINSVLEGN